MAGSAEVFAQIQRKPGVTYGALAPNLRGFEDALAAGVESRGVCGGVRGVLAAQYQLFHQRKPGALRTDHGRRQAARRQRARLCVLCAGLLAIRQAGFVAGRKIGNLNFLPPARSIFQ